MVRAPAKKHDVGHIRGWTDCCFDEEYKKEGMVQKKRKGERETRRQVSACGVGGQLGGLAVLTLQQVEHCTGGVDEPRGGERDHVRGRKGSGFLSLDAPPVDRNSPRCRLTSSSIHQPLI